MAGSMSHTRVLVSMNNPSLIVITGLSLGAGETAQGLGALAALPEDQGSISSTYMAAHSPVELQAWKYPMPSSGLQGHCT